MGEFLTAFDAIAITLILVSALMALARGFMRELATLGAFIAALAGAYYAHQFLRNRIAGFFGEGAPGWLPDLVVVVVVFLIIYCIVAWFGARLSRNIQGLDGIGILDRVAGVVFGAARGAIAVVFFVLLLGLALTPDDIPGWIKDARTYPVFQRAAAYVQVNAPRIADDVRETLPVAEPVVEPDAEPE